MKRVSDQIISVPGFKASGVACGIKTEGRKDLALIFTQTPAVAAGVFTKNKVLSHAVVFSKKGLRKSRSVRAVLVNSGNAKACNNSKGLEDCQVIASHLGKVLEIPSRDVLLASTGVIGVPLPQTKILKGIPKLVTSLSTKGWKQAAEAIMTTDLVIKTARVGYSQGKHNIVIGGLAKGSGMIHPNMATMLAFINTNASVDQKTLQMALKLANEGSFNRITVDGDTSTNDCVICMANGKAPLIRKGSSAFSEFVDALTKVCKNLAIKIVKDGEGATKFITVRVQGARSSGDAKKVATSVAKSSLVKTACFGEDPNWGRIFAAVGYASVSFNPERVDIILNGLTLIKSGVPLQGISLETLRKKMKQKSITIEINLHAGRQVAEIYTCDLSYNYIKINAEYTT